MKKNLVDFFYELGQLKRVKRSGWWLIGIKDPESVAEHSFRAAAIGYILAKMENVDSKKVILACLFNDLHEARINDLHKVGHKYIDFKVAETKAFSDAMKNLPDAAAKELQDVFAGFQLQDTKEGMVARDADLLECVIQAKEYIKHGKKEAQNWIDNCRDLIYSKSAKKLFKDIEKSDPDNWWKDLKKIDR